MADARYLDGSRVPKPIAVAAVQMSVKDGDPRENVGRAIDAMDGNPGADCYLLPELWTTGYAHDRWPEVASHDSEWVIENLSTFCRERRSYVGGSAIERDGEGRLVNRFRMIDPEGRSVGVYDKAHLFPPMLEDVHLSAGRERTRFQLEGWVASPSICFDLRFPVMYRIEAIAGVDLFLVVSAWPKERSAIMRGLAWARAVENQAYLVLCNRAGMGADGTEFGGGSLVVAPDGSVLAEADSGETVIEAQLDPSRMAIRAVLPVLSAEIPTVDGHPPIDLAETIR